MEESIFTTRMQSAASKYRDSEAHETLVARNRDSFDV